MDKEDLLKKIEELKQFVESCDKKKENPYGLTGEQSVGIYDTRDGHKSSLLEEALNTWLELLSCDGVEEKVDDEQWYLELFEDSINVGWSDFLEEKIDYISPAFDTKENAQKAIDIIGEDRLMKMFKVFGGSFK